MDKTIPLRNIPDSIRKLIVAKHRKMQRELGMKKLAMGRAAILLIKDLHAENQSLKNNKI